MLSKYMGKIALVVIIVFTVLSMSLKANATNIHLRICGKWRSQYTDSGLGEDMFVSTSLYDRRAAYARYKVTLASDDSVVKSEGVLDTSGCTPYFVATDGVQYKIRQRTKFERSGGRIAYVQPVQTGTTPVYNNWYISYVSYYTPSGHSSYQLVTKTNVVYAVFHTNIGPILDRMMRYANTLDIPSSTIFQMVGCYKGSGFSGNNNMYYMYIPGGTDHSAEKFRVAHEMGHAIGDMGSPRIRWGDSKTHSSNYCNCTDITTGPHCLQSWESIRLGQSEGFCHFISTQFFNYRLDGDGVFGSYRNTRFPNTGNPSDIWSEPYCNPTTKWCTAPWGVNADYAVRWMEHNCSGWTDSGVEWDWLNFFWKVWTEGPYRISISDIRDVWPTDTNSPSASQGHIFYEWYNIYVSAYWTLSYWEYLNFRSVGQDCGVDH